MLTPLYYLILPSYDCTQTADQLNCSCETVGNPPPALQWYLDGSPVNQSDRFAISNEPLNISGLRSIIAVSQPEGRALRLSCNSSNSLGSTTTTFFISRFEPHGWSLCGNSGFLEINLVLTSIIFVIY
uniref:Ig-like domain-containing protein n=1 Tax=Sparus aurata TaxID=8175 RepID=A0A671Y5F4_SPAAU